MQNNEVKIKGRAYRYTVSHTKSGRTICTFGLQFYNGKDQDGKSKYAFVNCKSFEDLKLVDKQDVFVIGRLAVDEWTDKQGQKKSSTSVVVEKLETEEKQEETTFNDDTVPF